MAEGFPSIRSLSCPICMEEFHEPKMLPCGHTYCGKCLNEMLKPIHGYIKCPLCQEENILPQSGKVEDFPTNFVVTGVASELRTQSQIKVKARQPLSMTGDTAGLECPQHKKLMKFYCQTCKTQVCDECLQADHKLGKHCCVTLDDERKLLSDRLHNLIGNLNSYEEENLALGEKINLAINNCQQEAQKLLGVTLQVYQIERGKLDSAFQKMVTIINGRSNQRTSTYANLQQQNSLINTLYSQTEGTCKSLNQDFQQNNLSRSVEIENIHKSLENLKQQIDSLKATCQSTPSNLGLTVNQAQSLLDMAVIEDQLKPIILQAGDIKNGNCNPLEARTTVGQPVKGVGVTGPIIHSMPSFYSQI